MLNDKGLTLLEALVSLLILSVGILGLAPLVVLSIEGNNISRDVLTVSSLAKEKLEMYSNPDSLPVLPYRESESGLEGDYYRYTYIYDNVTDTTMPSDLAHIEVTIKWVDKVGVTRASQYTSILDK